MYVEANSFPAVSNKLSSAKWLGKWSILILYFRVFFVVLPGIDLLFAKIFCAVPCHVIAVNTVMWIAFFFSKTCYLFELVKGQKRFLIIIFYNVCLFHIRTILNFLILLLYG